MPEAGINNSSHTTHHLIKTMEMAIPRNPSEDQMTITIVVLVARMIDAKYIANHHLSLQASMVVLIIINQTKLH